MVNEYGGKKEVEDVTTINVQCALDLQLGLANKSCPAEAFTIKAGIIGRSTSSTSAGTAEHTGL